MGHAAMLAAIQRYVPGLVMLSFVLAWLFCIIFLSLFPKLTNIRVFVQIPSTYGSERLNLLRQLEKVKQMQNETEPEEGIDEAES